MVLDALPTKNKAGGYPRQKMLKQIKHALEDTPASGPDGEKRGEPKVKFLELQKILLKIFFQIYYKNLECFLIE